MEREFNISIVGTQMVDDEKSTIEIFTKGRFSRHGEGFIITYEESETTGMNGAITRLTIDKGSCVTLSRSGTSKTQLIVEKGQRHLCHYDTGYGEIMVGVNAGDIVSELTDDGGVLKFNYTLDINSTLASKNEVEISIREAKMNYESHPKC